MKKLSVRDRAMMPLVQKELSTEDLKALKPWENPKTAPGGSMAFHIKESVVFAENEKLKAELETFRDGSLTRVIDAALISRSKWANRHQESFKDKAFDDLKAEIRDAGGNVQPIKVRPLFSEAGKFEVVFGHRRHQACMELGLPVLAMIEDLSEQELFAQMDRENRSRKDLRPFEQGVMYARALDEGLFPSLRKMAEALGVDASNASKAISLARLPDVVIGVFESPLMLQQGWASPLTDALQNSPESVLVKAKELAAIKGKISAQEAFKSLISASVVSNHTPAAFSARVVKGAGRKSGKISFDPQKSAFSVVLNGLEAEKMDEIEDFLKKILG
jgi:ParB family chromosome partitioning protein